MGEKISISQGLGWLKILKMRHEELVRLRSDNSYSGTRLYGDAKTVDVKPTYDVKVLDKLINNVAKEIRKLDEALKRANATVIMDNYEMDESVLGELQ